ncbi:MAG: hypothetical protein HY909_29865 [Deltaproteobacteria bacterium]|nr:hypothetical protein [Deltaproteobacteria bacterium]
MSPTRAALHALVDQIPDKDIGRAIAALAPFSANDALTPSEEASLRQRLQDLAEGRVIPASVVLAELRAKLAAR